MPALNLPGDLFRLLLPSTCLGCGDRPRGRLPLCASCGMRLCPVRAWDLSRAEAALAGIDGLTVLWMLDPGGPARALVHGLKYAGLRRIGAECGRMLGRALLDSRGLPCHAIVPVPLHRTKLVERGYNQSEWIARGAAEPLGIPVWSRAVVRRTPGTSQTRSGRRARSHTVRNAFTVRRPEDVAGKRLLLVDDVLTTGATASAVARTLLDSGADRVHLATIGLTRKA